MKLFTIFSRRGEEPEAVDRLGTGVEVVHVSSLAQVEADGRVAVLVLDAELAKDGDLGSLPSHVSVLAKGPEGSAAAERVDRLFLDLDDMRSPDAQLRAIRSAARMSATQLAESRAGIQLSEMRGDLRGLNRIGMALMSERDPDTLLGMILKEARRLTSSDAGSLYLVEQGEDGSKTLHFLRAQNDSLPDLKTPDLICLPLDETSLAGYVALHDKPLIIEDAYEIPDSEPYSFSQAFDSEVGYRARSMLVVPMKDHLDEVVGVLQLINRKSDLGGVIRDEASSEKFVLGYEERDVELVQSLAGQAAVSIENGRLYQEIEGLFEGFIKASVIAIDQRDPTTAGHSVRVATLTCDIAEVVDRATDGAFRDTRITREQMRELRYAGLLHDFGKVGVREDVLVKSTKLPPVLLENGREGFDEFLQGLEQEYESALQKVDHFHEAVRESNVPNVLPEASAEILNDIVATTFRSFENEQVPYITRDELHFLAIPKGSLDLNERQQIQSHVTHTYNFLMQIPWTASLAQVADIAHGHHEKLDGTGYPRGIEAEEIALQTRIMTVSDIFDALTASDRPYKSALSETRALEILDLEAEAGMLDSSVVRLLISSEVYRKILDRDWMEF